MRRGRIYWLIKNFAIGFFSFTKKHPIISIVGLLVIGSLLFISRGSIQPYFVLARRFIFIEVLVLIFISAWWKLFKRSAWKGRIVYGVLLILFATGAYYVRLEPYNYLALYLRYNSLEVRELNDLPVTNYERIHPQNSITTLAKETVSETESFNTPDYVRVGDSYRWTTAVEPQYFYQKILESVEEVISVSGLAPAPFSGRHREKVHFDIGENLKFSRNTKTATIKRFRPAQFLSYEPADVKYVKDDKGEWIQIVTLIKWEGIFFPVPVFGGVYVIEQGYYDLVGILRRSFFGAGTFIAPENFEKYPFLKKQNILPYEVSRFIANSFRFQDGFLAPMPGYHKGDIRIPDLEEDINDQPFTTYFDFSAINNGMSMLHHYYGLEPFDPTKQGLNTSLFVPADGTDIVYVYRHFKQKESLAGASAIAAKVIESRKEFDWSVNRPVEHRPYIKTIHNKKRFFWLTTVVTLKNRNTEKSNEVVGESKKDQEFFAGSVPGLILTDAIYKKPIWVDASNPDSWQADLEKEMGSIWKFSE